MTKIEKKRLLKSCEIPKQELTSAAKDEANLKKMVKWSKPPKPSKEQMNLNALRFK